MGNLWQENRFNTEGDGIAQWLGGRLERLRQRENPQDLATQLDYIIHELQTTERHAHNMLVSTTSVEEATTAFQNYYERCNPYYCMHTQRIAYAVDFYWKNKA